MVLILFIISNNLYSVSNKNTLLWRVQMNHGATSRPPWPSLTITLQLVDRSHPNENSAATITATMYTEFN